MTGAVHEDQYISLIICRSVFLGMKSVPDKSCRENRNTHFMFNKFFVCVLEIRALYEVMWKVLSRRRADR